VASVPAVQQHFGPELFEFLLELRADNDRDWFARGSGGFGAEAGILSSPAGVFGRWAHSSLSLIDSV